MLCVFFFQAEDGIRDLVRSRGLGDVYKRQGYVVNEHGEVKLPLIGAILLTGKTINEATQALETKFREYMEDPIVTVKKLNFKVTVLGEVNLSLIHISEPTRPY